MGVEQRSAEVSLRIQGEAPGDVDTVLLQRSRALAHISCMTGTASVWPPRQSLLFPPSRVAVRAGTARAGRVVCRSQGVPHLRFLDFSCVRQVIGQLPFLVKPMKTLAPSSPTIETHCGHASRIDNRERSKGSTGTGSLPHCGWPCVQLEGRYRHAWQLPVRWMEQLAT